MQHCVIFNALKEYCIPKEEEELYLQHVCICVEQIPKMGPHQKPFSTYINK